MDKLEKVINDLPFVAEMIFAMYKDATDKTDIRVLHDHYVCVTDALELLKDMKKLLTKKQDELILNQKETVAFIRNITQPNLEVIDRKNAFLKDRDDIVYSFSEDSIVAECNNIDCIYGIGEV